MIRNSKEKTAWAYRTIRECPPAPDANVDITLFANYYGSVKQSHRFNDPALYTDKKWYNRFMDEITEMKIFRRNKKA
jgi:hypothetical protein